MADTLLLNSDGQPLSMLPLSTLTWKDAMRLIFLDKVRIIEEYENWDIHSATETYSVPSVVMIKKYIKRKTDVRLTRGNLYLRDKYQCQYCGDRFRWDELTYDHVIPTSKGGQHKWDNLVASCKPCNGKKGAKIIDPLNDPYVPTYWDLINSRLSVPIIIRHYSWKRFITPGDGGFKLIKPTYTI